MTDCERFLPDLKAYIDGELPRFTRRRIRQHLRRCSSCREEMTLMESITNELQQGDSTVLEPTLRDKLLAGVPSAPADSPLSAKPNFRERWRGTKRKPLIIWGTASASLVAWFFLAPLFHSGQRTDSVAREVAGTSIAGNAMAKMSAPASPMPDGHASDMMKAPPSHDGKAVGGGGTGGGGTGGGGFGGGSTGITNKSYSNMQTLSSAAPQVQATSPINPAESAKARSSVANITRDVHRTATLTVEVKSAESASEAVEMMVKETKGGYVAENQLTTNDDGTKTANLTIKVPVNDFDSFLSRASKQGIVKAKSITGEDVTENISDTSQERKSLTQQAEEARQNLQAARSRQQRNEASQEVRDLKVQIAQAEGRLELLKRSARLSDVTLELREKPKESAPVKTGGFVDQIKETAQMAQENFVSAARVPVLLLIWVVVYSPLWLLVVFAYRLVTRRYYTTPNS
ncbi:MAG: DUF4349 domain-containing protein [Armatimonadetes bacterium]|nr:DUF4349 domain-containing protein [Armatimonadota bacterium]